MAEDETIDRDEVQEISRQKVGEIYETQQDAVGSGEVSAVPTPGFDVYIATSTCNVPHASSDSILGVNLKVAIENMLLIATEGGLVGGYECDDTTIGS
ncbi:hypothetical protein A4A49_23295 [Nicotiana attenuata]|uniref:Uncharacterized protein n=1 Tax=Nicotiana attenuata TaxID=49451 RepID=A0A314KWL6_NICAT|nr:hypothetical protein A4A49_23295 [Nicotiana attenuata]